MLLSRADRRAVDPQWHKFQFAKAAVLARMERRQTHIIGQRSNFIATVEGGSCFIQTAFQSTCRKAWRLDSYQRRRSGSWRYRWSCWPCRFASFTVEHGWRIWRGWNAPNP